MTGVIEKLRKENGFYGYKYNEAISDLLIEAYEPEGYLVVEVDETFSEGGRWSNYRHTVYKVVEGDEVAYFKVSQEEPATESQEGGDFR